MADSTAKDARPGSDRKRRLRKVVLRSVVLVMIAINAALLSGYLKVQLGGQCPLVELRFSKGQSVEQIAAGVSLAKTEAGLDLWRTPSGDIWTVHGERGLPYLIWEEQKDVYEPAGHQVQRGDIVLDCGANIGSFVRTALSRGAGLVVAIEPSPRTLDALRRNFEAEIRAKRVIVYPKGVWDRDAELDLSINETNEGIDSVVNPTEGGPKVRVPLTTIDKAVAELGLPRVDFIKMDIEGAEKQALRGARDTIKRFRPRMSISSEHLSDDFTAIPAVVKSIDARYSYRGCDCDKAGMSWKWKALVIAFDPIRE